MSIKAKIDGVDSFKDSPPLRDSKRSPQDQTAKKVDSVRSKNLPPDRPSSRSPSALSDNGGPLRRSSGRHLLLADEDQAVCEYVAADGLAVFNVENKRSPGGSLIKAQSAQRALDESSAPAAGSSSTKKASTRKSNQMQRQKTPVERETLPAIGSPPHLVVPVRPTVPTTRGFGENPSPFKVSPRTDNVVNQERVSSDPLPVLVPVPGSSGQLQSRSKSTPVKKTDPRSTEEIQKAKLISEVTKNLSQKGEVALLEYAWRGQMDHLTVFFDEINKVRKEGPREPIVRELSPFQHLVSPDLRGNILIEGFNSINCDVDKRRKLLELLCPINIMKKEKIEELRITGCELLFRSQVLWSFVTELVDKGKFQDLDLIVQQIPISGDLVGDLLVRATKNRHIPNRDQIIEQLMTKQKVIPAIYLEEVAILIKERQAAERRNTSSVCVIC